MAKQTVVIKISGKHIDPDKTSLIRDYVAVLRSLHQEGYRIAVVVGGGPTARKYIAAARSVGANRAFQDILGIEAARLNARLLAAALHPDAYPEPPRSIWEALEAAATGKIVVAGGFQPGQSTAGVAAVLAEALNADLLVVATTVDGVYTDDPRRNPQAQLIPRLSYERLREVLSQTVEPGRYELLDPLAITVLERSGIKTRIVNGLEPVNVYKAVHMEDVGSLVEP
ncbi:UMP kinase [Pyrofollis japonicus]|uniref:UMP kinase n=1 Tax=Pyrofollis japonicus TaxID=3060460 RepID=UPI00295A882A|nr:UMP kinase [Pyrofollis japonicus]BEP16887.1 UMP kinase [Pyrofollis japonicus]